MKRPIYIPLPHIYIERDIYISGVNLFIYGSDLYIWARFIYMARIYICSPDIYIYVCWLYICAPDLYISAIFIYLLSYLLYMCNICIGSRVRAVILKQECSVRKLMVIFHTSL